ncbi:MAG TPA: protein phosphatase 2C domain-containing protein [Vicinamibacterales bacterium]|nr:protein phosphatase 2C domain-containing protein [Vicinamibacterales bacterium]
MMVGHGATHPGRVRPRNEDSLLLDPRIGLFAVADGMGGHNAGEVASCLALQTIHTFVARSGEDPDHTWPFGIDSALDFDGNRLRTAVKLANRQVYRESEARDQYTGMGTTVAAMLFTDRSVNVCSVGDSRVYLVRQGRIECLTRDQTWVQLLLAQNPELDPASIAEHPMRHVLTAVVGAQDELEIQLLSRTVSERDRFVISSDGVHGALDAPEIAAIVNDAPGVDEAAERLVQAALEKDGSDNLTAVVVEVAS